MEGSKKKSSRYPMFRTGTNLELAEWADRLGFSLQYIMKIRDGYRDLGPQAKVTWAARAGLSVEEMFGSPSDEQARAR